MVGEARKEILVPFPADRMKAWPISARVNSPKNNDAEIVMPIELQSVSRSEDFRNYFDAVVEVNIKNVAERHDLIERLLST
jgi:hypothetical protein